MKLSDMMSPSMRREWIEISDRKDTAEGEEGSPSMRREWIEIQDVAQQTNYLKKSPSMRREWIEIHDVIIKSTDWKVSLHAEGVD